MRRLEALLASSGATGIDTSEGLLFNHTLWGRDRAITALDVLDRRPDVARQSILALARLQGTARRFRSEEEPGRIHSEHRDFRRWQAPAYLKLILRSAVSPLWGGDSASYTSYFAADSTPLYLMLVSEYARTDPGILGTTVERRRGSRVTVRDTIMLAAAWLLEHMNGDGLIEISGRNPVSLPSPVWRDSPSSNLDEYGRMPNILEPIAWLDMQLLTFEAFRGLAAMLRAEAAGSDGAARDTGRREAWGSGEPAAVHLRKRADAERHADAERPDNTERPADTDQGGKAETARLLEDLADVIRAATLRDFWMPGEQYFGFAVDQDRCGRRRLLRAVQSNAGWLLAGRFFGSLPAEERAMYVSGIVRTLFSPDMLTDAGVRGRSRRYSSLGFLNYHEPVWPMDSLWVAQGLRHQGLDKLAEQIENRVLNAVNALGAHYEFIPVDPGGRIIDPTLNRRRARAADPPGRPLPTEMVPDVDLAWSVTGVLRVKWERAQRERARRDHAQVERVQREGASRDDPQRERATGGWATGGRIKREPETLSDHDGGGHEPWVAELTGEIMTQIEDVPALRSRAGLDDLRGNFSTHYLSHWSGLLRSGRFTLAEGLGRALPTACLGRLRSASATAMYARCVMIDSEHRRTHRYRSPGP